MYGTVNSIEDKFVSEVEYLTLDSDQACLFDGDPSSLPSQMGSTEKPENTTNKDYQKSESALLLVQRIVHEQRVKRQCKGLQVRYCRYCRCSIVLLLIEGYLFILADELGVIKKSGFLTHSRTPGIVDGVLIPGIVRLRKGNIVLFRYREKYLLGIIAKMGMPHPTKG